MISFSGSRVSIPQGHTLDIQGAINLAASRGAVRLLRGFIKEIEPHSKSGNLLRSWSIEEIPGGALVSSSDPASTYLDKGTKRHSIDAPFGGFLRFELEATAEGSLTPVAGETDIVFARHVNHPGITGIHYVKKVLLATMPGIRADIAAAAEDEIRLAIFGTGPRAGQTFLRGIGGRFVG